MPFIKIISKQLPWFGWMLLVAACTSEVKDQAEKTTAISDSIGETPSAPAPDAKEASLASLAGNYISGEYPEGYYQLLKITDKPSNQYEVQFTASEVKGRPACNFAGAGSVVNDTLKVPVEWHDKTVQMTLFLRNDTILVFTENFDDRFALNYYCSGGASLIGDYVRSGVHNVEP